MRVYLVDVGVLLTKDDDEFESYATVYNKNYGYYDEGQHYVATLEEAKAEVNAYVKDGVERTYGIVSNATLDDDLGVEDLDEIDVEYEEYIQDNVVYSVAKIEGEIVEDFLEKDYLFDLEKEER